MPKRSITLLLLITMTLGPVSAAFAEVMDKINLYSVYIPQTNTSLSGRNPLWFSVKDDTGQQLVNEANYATAVYQEAVPIFGQDQATYALGMFGKIGAVDAELPGYEGFFITNEPSEYYFTDMVFIQQKYEEALVDLYFYRAEASGSSRNPDNRAIMDEAIAGTYWVAQQNGVTYSEEQIQEIFIERLDEQLDPVASEFKSRFEDIDENIDEYTDAFVSALKEYYLDPKIETFEKVIEISYEFDQSSDNMVIYWSSFFHNIVAPISEGLAISFTGRGRENKSRFSR